MQERVKVVRLGFRLDENWYAMNEGNPRRIKWVVRLGLKVGKAKRYDVLFHVKPMLRGSIRVKLYKTASSAASAMRSLLW